MDISFGMIKYELSWVNLTYFYRREKRVFIRFSSEKKCSTTILPLLRYWTAKRLLTFETAILSFHSWESISKSNATHSISPNSNAINHLLIVPVCKKKNYFRKFSFSFAIWKKNMLLVWSYSLYVLIMLNAFWEFCLVLRRILVFLVWFFLQSPSIEYHDQSF